MGPVSNKCARFPSEGGVVGVAASGAAQRVGRISVGGEPLAGVDFIFTDSMTYAFGFRLRLDEPRAKRRLRL
jgi:hypothetical protein